jgi:hypothetical protein
MSMCTCKLSSLLRVLLFIEHKDFQSASGSGCDSKVKKRQSTSFDSRRGERCTKPPTAIEFFIEFACIFDSAQRAWFTRRSEQSICI